MKLVFRVVILTQLFISLVKQALPLKKDHFKLNYFEQNCAEIHSSAETSKQAEACLVEDQAFKLGFCLCRSQLELVFGMGLTLRQVAYFQFVI